MESAEDPVAVAERHVREGTARVARQERIVAEMARDDHPEAERVGKQVLARFERTLELMREHLETPRSASRPPPSR
jgi:hypothetical protein